MRTAVFEVRMRRIAYFAAGVVVLGAGFGLGYLWAHRQGKPVAPTTATSDSTAPRIWKPMGEHASARNSWPLRESNNSSSFRFWPPPRIDSGWSVDNSC